MLPPGFYNMDCMEALKEYPDKYFELAIVDPPYGGAGGKVERRGGKWSAKYGKKGAVPWDLAPGQEYFSELFRVSQNQIIWGGQLLFPSAYTVLCGVAETMYQRELYHGHDRIRMDEL